MSDFRRLVATVLWTMIADQRLKSIQVHPNAAVVSASATRNLSVRELDGFEWNGEARSGAATAALEVMLLQIERLERDGFTAVELDRARALYRRSLERLANTGTTSNGRRLAEEPLRATSSSTSS